VGVDGLPIARSVAGRLSFASEGDAMATINRRPIRLNSEEVKNAEIPRHRRIQKIMEIL